MTEEHNTFAKMVKDKAIPEENINQQELITSGEIDLTDFSDSAVGDKKKYERPDLKDKSDIVEKFQVFTPDINKETPKETQNGGKFYWPVTMILTYESKNADGLNNREYIPGARVWQNDRTETNSKDINFWYEGGETQSCYLWELVAKKLAIAPKEMSPRQFSAFLNSKPKVQIIGFKTKNYNAPAGSPKHIFKNMPGEFI